MSDFQEFDKKLIFAIIAKNKILNEEELNYIEKIIDENIYKYYHLGYKLLNFQGRNKI